MSSSPEPGAGSRSLRPRRRLGLHWAGFPLGWRLVVVTVAVLTAILAVFGSILYADLGATMLDTTASNLDTTARAAALQEQHTTFASNPAGGGNNRPPPPAAGQPDGQRRVDGIFLPPLNGGEALFYSTLVDNLTSPGLSASVIDPSGAIVANGPAEQPFPTTPSPTLLPAVYQQVVAAHQSRHLRVQTANGAELVELIPLVQPVRGSITVVGVLQLNTSLRLVDSLLDRLRLLLIAGTLLAAVATVTLIIPLIRAVLAPLGRMAATSRAIAAGDLHQRVTEAESHDELADLAAAFNDMVDRLASLLASQRRFLADASHELRTPLTALAGGMEMLVLGADRADPAARARLLRLLQGEVERMGRLVDDLMTLTRLDARGKAALTLAVVDIRTLAEQVVEETRLLAPDMNVKADVPKAPVTVLGDADRLHQVLLNLVTNARAHMAPSGTITLSVLSSQDADQRGQARLAVTDTGEGIAPDHLPHIFDRFYRADQARERQGGGGLGLGLAIVRAIVENHGGTVEITSALDVGTTVTVILPTVRTVVAAQPALQTAS